MLPLVHLPSARSQERREGIKKGGAFSVNCCGRRACTRCRRERNGPCHSDSERALYPLILLSSTHPAVTFSVSNRNLLTYHLESHLLLSLLLLSLTPIHALHTLHALHSVVSLFVFAVASTSVFPPPPFCASPILTYLGMWKRGLGSPRAQSRLTGGPGHKGDKSIKEG